MGDGRCYLLSVELPCLAFLTSSPFPSSKKKDTITLAFFGLLVIFVLLLFTPSLSPFSFFLPLLLLVGFFGD